MSIDRTKFFESIRHSQFGGKMRPSQAEGLNALLDAWEKFKPSANIHHLAYALATAHHETAATMQAIEEYGKGRGRAYGHPAGPWHQIYDGRGDVQLTWLANYRKATKRLLLLGVINHDEDLARTPALAMRPDIAAAVMFFGMSEGWFTGRKLGQYFNDRTNDPVGARRIINGKDRAALIAAIYRGYLAALS